MQIFKSQQSFKNFTIELTPCCLLDILKEKIVIEKIIIENHKLWDECHLGFYFLLAVGAVHKYFAREKINGFELIYIISPYL